MKDKNLLITAGPTWEAIDPVRGITNHSSGKMGYALARAASERGANVTLVSGPVCLPPPEDVETLAVSSAWDMYDAVHRRLQGRRIDVFIGVAAVADYRPADVQEQKIKKSTDELTLRLVKNPDIVASVAALEVDRPYTVGFAAETENLEQYARGKLVDKNLDMIIANDVSRSDTGFGSDSNQVLLITRNHTLDSGYLGKTELAHHILKHIEQELNP